MTQEEFNALTKEQVKNMPEEEFLKHLIRFCEERYIWYKKQIEFVFKNKESFPPEDEMVIWYKEHLREQKNFEESKLKELRIEIEHLRQGLNPPWCYPHYWKTKESKNVD